MYIFKKLRRAFYFTKVFSWTPCISKMKFLQDVGKRRRNLFTFTDQRKTQFLLMWKSGWNLFVKQNHYYFLNNRQERHFLTLSLSFFLVIFFNYLFSRYIITFLLSYQKFLSKIKKKHVTNENPYAILKLSNFNQKCCSSVVVARWQNSTLTFKTTSLPDK